jgi:PKD repeat protein/Zn-dependent protease
MQKILPLFLLIPLLVCTVIPAYGSAAPVIEPGSGFIVVASAPSADFYTTTQSGSVPLRVTFFDRSEGTLPLQYLWDFGDGTTSTVKDPTHTFGPNGNYTVSLTVTNSYGKDTKTLPGYISVGDPPKVNFSVSSATGILPLTVTFTDRTSGSPRSWIWDFGDGSASTVQNPTHTYTKPGTYTVTVSSANEFGTGRITRSGLITTGIVPGAEFAVGPQEGDPPLTVSFHDFSSGTPLAWLWDFGDGSTSTEKDPVHAYSATGTYSVTLHVANAFGSDMLTRPNLVRIGESAPVIPPIQTQTVMPSNGENQPTGIVGMIRQARGTMEKNLPTSGLIPPQFLALAAVLTSCFFILVNLLISNIGALSQTGPKFAKFFIDLAGGHAVEKVSAAEIERRGIAANQRVRHFLGLSAAEVIVIEAAVIMVALAFVLADRVELTLGNVLIYILVGAISVVLHDFAHRYFATKHGHDADTQFWGLGTVIMFITAWLYGNAFAQSYRNLVNRKGEDNQREMGIEMVAGPCTSIILMILFLALTSLGGLYALAGGVGFTINLIMAVYSLMPIETMDGGAIWRWNRFVYLVLFIPMIAFYFFTYMIA